jgi:sulfide:quinone oxidoreductase
MRSPGDGAFRVLIVGGGVAALEAGLAIRALAGDRVALRLLAPESVFTYRPLEVREPFAGPSAPRYDLGQLAAGMGAALIHGRLGWVDAAAQTAWPEAGEPLDYDALVLAMGARPYLRHRHARTIEPGRLDELLHGFVQDIDGGYVRSAAFVVPDRVGWPLPIYELLLMTAERATSMWADVALTLVTSETAPLEVFGSEVSAEVARRLDHAQVTVLTSAHAEVPTSGLVEVTRARRHTRLQVDSVVALPELMGPAVRGLPGGEHGFIPVDRFGRVRGAERVFAAGDATDFPVKHGGVAAQQADAVALGVAASAGAHVQPMPFRPDIRGLLLTGGRPLALSGVVAGARGVLSRAEEGDACRPEKITALHLAPYLSQQRPLPAHA